jgi:hypothetical protein
MKSARSGAEMRKAMAHILSSVGFKRSDLVAIRNLPRFFRDWRSYSEKPNGALPLRLRDIYPALTDYDAGAGDSSTYYFYQDLWAARKIYQRRPSSHLDIGSRIDGFVAHLLTFMDVNVLDVRPCESTVPGLRFVQGDATELSHRIRTDRFVGALPYELSGTNTYVHFWRVSESAARDTVPESLSGVLRGPARDQHVVSFTT